MRAWEFINEGKKRPITKNGKHPNKDQEAVMPSALRFGGSNDKLLELLKLTKMVAASDGKTPLNLPDNWIGLNDTAHPYTKEEAEMLKKAFNAAGLEWQDALQPNFDNKSVEPKDTNVKSPINSFRGFGK